MSHPIVEATAAIDAALKQVADANPVFLATAEKEAALRELVSLEARLVELRLRIMATAADVAETTAAHDVAEWLTVRARVRHEDARAELRLAAALDRRYPVLGRALREGNATLAHAQVIARTLDDLPSEVPEEVMALAETTLVSHAAELGPRQLARVGRRILEVVAPEITDAVEARRLASLEADAHRRTRLSLRRVDEEGARLGEGRDPLSRPTYPRRLGEAFCQLLETLDPTRLPLHGGDATTLVVTIPLPALLDDLALGRSTFADLAGGHVAGDDTTTGAAGDRITASHARRLARTAGILPAVLGGDSEILDLGRTRRLFSPAQRRALRLRDRTCRAEGCDIPAAWCEAHHAGLPWSRGGRTDLDGGLLLCHHHHQRAHDSAYSLERLPSGDVRFHRRR